VLRHRGFFYGYISRRRRADNQHYLLQSATNCYTLQVRSETEEKMSNFLIGLGMFAMVFGTSMAEPMSTNVFLMQLGLIFGGISLAIYGGIIRK